MKASAHLSAEISDLKDLAIGILSTLANDEEINNMLFQFHQAAVKKQELVLQAQWRDTGAPDWLFFAVAALHNLLESEAHPLNELSSVEDAATYTLTYGNAIASLVATGNIPMLAFAEQFLRKGKPQTQTRPNASITDCLIYLIKRCEKENMINLLEPGEISNFMKYAKDLVADTARQDKFLSERIEKVIKRDGIWYFQMQEGHGKTRQNTNGNSLRYSQNEIRNTLRRIRKH